MKHPIQLLLCKIADIGCAPLYWIVLVSWYPHCVMIENFHYSVHVCHFIRYLAQNYFIHYNVSKYKLQV